MIQNTSYGSAWKILFEAIMQNLSYELVTTYGELTPGVEEKQRKKDFLAFIATCNYEKLGLVKSGLVPRSVLIDSGFAADGEINDALCLLATAVAYSCFAAIAAKEERHDVATLNLLHANYLFGMQNAVGPSGKLKEEDIRKLVRVEQARIGGSARAEKMKPARELARVLVTGREWGTIEDAAESVGKKISEEFKDLFPRAVDGDISHAMDQVKKAIKAMPETEKAKIFKNRKPKK